MKRAFATLLLIAAGFGIVSASQAQQMLGTEPITATIMPSYPRPYETVTIIPESTYIDLSASKVTVLVNGSVVSEGSGAEPAYVTVGGPGTVTTITIRATSGAQSFTKSLTIRPADVALVVEPYSTVHPFYEGGALTSSEGAVRLVAIPDLRTSSGAPIPAASLVYTWRNGDQILQGASGIGKSVLSASAPVRHRDARISVTVTSQDRSVVAEAATVVAPSDPFVRVYRNDPLLGPLYGTALPANTALVGTEETFRAVPYFFPDRPLLTWSVGDDASDNDQDITLRSSGSRGGTALVQVLAEVPDTGQSASQRLTITFKGESSLGFFGL
ncbi:MAG TPA: hypothetical protein VGB97_04015 [Candidatus Paceibacterota bacterium]|jgi:hypothetical protein